VLGISLSPNTLYAETISEQEADWREWYGLAPVTICKGEAAKFDVSENAKKYIIQGCLSRLEQSCKTKYKFQFGIYGKCEK
jgi:hypothetical protein